MSSISDTLAIRSALLDAKRRTGNLSLATSVQLGYFRVETVTFNDKGWSKVEPLTKWLKAEQVISYLYSL